MGGGRMERWTDFFPAWISPGLFFTKQTHSAVHDSPIHPARRLGPPPELPAARGLHARHKDGGGRMKSFSQVGLSGTLLHSCATLVGRGNVNQVSWGRSQNLSLRTLELEDQLSQDFSFYM